MLDMRMFIKAIPWFIILILGLLLYSQNMFRDEKPGTRISHSTVLQEIEALGKLELVKYNFKDITELEKQSKEYFFKIIKFGPDSKIALISVGSATGCLDLTRISAQDIRTEKDTLYIKLPEPELCSYKLDMEQTHIYALETNPMINEKKFIQQAYTLAEKRVKESALASGILDQTATNAELILKPLLEKVAGGPVVFTKQMRNHEHYGER